MVNLIQMAKGARVLLMNGVVVTTTSTPCKANGHNAITIYFNITAGSGTWTIKLQGKSPNGTFTDIYDFKGDQMYINGATADKAQSFLSLPETFRIVATEDGNGATVDVSYELFST